MHQAITRILQTRRDDVTATRCVDQTLEPLPDGAVRFAIDRIALTANTVSYALTGGALGYWDFFPTAEPWAQVPAMGWGEIVESANDAISVGGRYYGWYPVAGAVDVQARPIPTGLLDDGQHRQQHASIYRAFQRSDLDPMMTAGDDAEDRHALLRGLFLTGFLADDAIAQARGDDPYELVILSASSKTAIALAQCAGRRDNVRVTGLTSAASVDRVAAIDGYDRVVAYDAVQSLSADAPAVVVDMSGNGTMLAKVHEALGDQLVASMLIGKSHHDQPAPPDDLPGPKPAFFFAPHQAETLRKQLGEAEMGRRVGEALTRFIDDSRDWLTVRHVNGMADVERLWAELAANAIPSTEGLILRPSA